ncbi:MAG: APA family basic amino acid/polyamine antiporter [Pirellulaceae bacterium]|jgi:APA family basic amino acid/polyamine antiporter
MNDPSNKVELKRQLSLFDSVCIIVGIIIGSGFYGASDLVTSQFSSLSVLILVWILGGVIGLIGALCYAELATKYPGEGGDYLYLSTAYGSRMGMFFSWCQFWIVRPGNIGAMAFVFAEYANQIADLGENGGLIYALASVVFLTGMNSIGVRSGKLVQNLLTSVKVIGLLAIVLVTLCVASPPADVLQRMVPVAVPDFHLAVIMVLFAYGGWNDIAFVTAEMKNPQKNIFRGLLLGVATVTTLYVLLTVAFVYAMGMAASSEGGVPANLLNLLIGDWGGIIISLLICVSCLGAMNGMIFAGARIYYAIGCDYPNLSWLGKWNLRFDAPLRTLFVQGLVIMMLIVGLGSAGDGFKMMVFFTTPFFYFFFLLVAISLLILRGTDPKAEGYRAPFHPLMPILFALFCLYLIYSGLLHLFKQIDPNAISFGIWWCIATIIFGMLASLTLAKRSIPKKQA